MQNLAATLFIPGLFMPAGDPAQLATLLKRLPKSDLTALERLLGRAHAQGGNALDDEARLCSLFGLEVAENGCPVAALTRLADGGSGDGGYWLRADPVLMVPDRDKVVMFGNRHLNVTLEERNQLREEFNRLFTEDGLRLETPTGQRWYLHVSDPPQITTTPLRQVIGRNVHPHLPKGEKAIQWHKLLGEVEMLFHVSGVNQQRRERRQPEISSLWLWGGGRLPAPAATPWQRLWSNEVLGRGLAQRNSVAQSTLPATAEEWQEQRVEAGEHLLVLDALRQVETLLEWHEFIAELERSWFAPLLAALKSGDLQRLTLISDGRRFDLDRKQLGRWWRGRGSFERHLLGVTR